MADEFNPNHPVTIQMRDHWHKIALVIMKKLGIETIDIFQADLDAIDTSEGCNIVIHNKRDRITIRIVTDAEGRRLAREHGGLPV